MQSFLFYGAVGLALALAILAYRLIAREQQRPGQPRRSVITTVYAYMAFALAIAGAGFWSEFAQLKLKNDLQALSKSIRPLLGAKAGAIGGLDSLDPTSEMYKEQLARIRDNLKSIDQSIQEIVGRE